jgi:hypothetical protein
MPAFGLLGIDFGHGFDALPASKTKRMGNPFYYWTTILKKLIYDFLIHIVMRKQFLYLFF